MFGQTNVDETIYPVYYQGKIVSTIEVFVAAEGIGGCYSQNYASQLNQAARFTTSKHPLQLVYENNRMFAVIGDRIYNFSGNMSELSTNLTFDGAEWDCISVKVDRLAGISTNYGVVASIGSPYQRDSGYIYDRN